MTESTTGQINRKNIRASIEADLPNFCPNTLEKIANFIAYKYNLSPYTVRYTYLPMFIDVGILVRCENGLYKFSGNGHSEKEESFMEYAKKHPNKTEKETNE